MIATVAGYGSTAVAVAGLALRQGGVRPHVGPVERLIRRHLTTGVTCAIIATLLWTPPIQIAVTNWTDNRFVAYHAAYALIMISATGMTGARTWLRAPAQARQRNAVRVSVLTGLLVVGAYLLRRGDLAADLADDVVANVYIFSLYGGHMLAYVRYAAHEPKRLPRWAIATTGAAAACGLTGLLVETIAIVIAAVHGQDVAAMNPIAMLLVSLANALGAAGTSMTVWLPLVLQVWDLVRGYWFYLALHPLWRVLTTRYPAVVMPYRPRDIDARLHRRVVEIYEALRLARADHADTGRQDEPHDALPRWVLLASSGTRLSSVGATTPEAPADDGIDPLRAARALRRAIRQARRHDAWFRRALARTQTRPRRGPRGRSY